MLNLHLDLHLIIITTPPNLIYGDFTKDEKIERKRNVKIIIMKMRIFLKMKMSSFVPSMILQKESFYMTSKQKEKNMKPHKNKRHLV